MILYVLGESDRALSGNLWNREQQRARRTPASDRDRQRQTDRDRDRDREHRERERERERETGRGAAVRWSESIDGSSLLRCQEVHDVPDDLGWARTPAVHLEDLGRAKELSKRTLL